MRRLRFRFQHLSQNVLVRCFPAFFRHDLEMFCAVRVAVHLHEHLRAFVEMLIIEDVPPHSGISLNGDLALQVPKTHPCDDFLSSRERRIFVRRSGRCRKQQQSSKQEMIFHCQNSKTNFARYSRHDELKNPPNLALVRLFCTSRGSKRLKRLKTPPPARACMRFSPKCSVIGRVICRSSEENLGKRSTFRGPTYSRSSFSTE